MTNQDKSIIIALIGKGKIQDAIDKLLSIDFGENKKKEALAISSRYKRLKSQNRLGILSFERVTTIENQIVNHLIDLINFPDDQTYPSEKSIRKFNTSYQKEKKSLGYKIGIIGSIASILGLLFYFLPLWDEQSFQMTVYVTDTKGNVVLEHRGELNTSLGNRPMRETIGEHGRTNFDDILPKHLGDSITIGFKAEGWKLAESNNNYVFDGKPIYLKIKKDESLGIIKGLVKTQNGQNLIEGAEVLINTDTIILTDANGIFNLILPDNMRVTTATNHYKLTVSKKGFKTASQYYFPRTNAEIRLEKQ